KISERLDPSRPTNILAPPLQPSQIYMPLRGGGTREDYEVYAESCFSHEKRALLVARDVTSKYTRRNRGEYEKIADYIYRTVAARPGNYMVFCPSYTYMQEIFHVYEELFGGNEGISCILQSEHMTEEERSGFLDRFRSIGEIRNSVETQGKAPCQTGENGLEQASLKMRIEAPCQSVGNNETQNLTRTRKALLAFCVLGGIFSEGIDLAGESLIGAVIIGTGLPQIGQEKELLRRYFDQKGENGFDYAYRYPGMNKVMQAAGRVIRTKEDVGVVVLLDERFLQGQYRGIFPREWDNYQAVSLNTVQKKLKEFWDGNNT
ncbi:MAG: ATP-dependent DNA helicase, partial [Lachnospiraceae bacterium]|nr:ATP-dependent DNA helicase [Lachnospiraceae bacterium]